MLLDAPPDVHHGQYSLSVIESLSHPRQARKNQVQRWQLSLRAGAYRWHLGIGDQGTVSDPLQRTVVSFRVRF